MTYQITPERAKEFKEQMEKLLPDEEIQRKMWEVSERPWEVEIPETSELYLSNEMNGLLREYLKSLGWFTYRWYLRNVDVIGVNHKDHEFNEIKSKVSEINNWISSFDKAIKLGIHIYLDDARRESLEDCLTPMNMEWVEKVIREEYDKPFHTKEDVIKIVNDYLDKLKKENVEAQKKEFEREFSIVQADTPNKFPISCFALGAIGAFIVFAILLS